MPVGECDTHAHVIGPYEMFPLQDVPDYPPPLAPFELYLEMLARSGIDRGVLIQSALYGSDNRALVDAVRRGGGRLRGVGACSAEVLDSSLALMHEAGIRGLRFSEMRDPRGSGRYKGCIGFDQLYFLAPRLKDLGWHAQLWAKTEDLAEWLPGLVRLGIPLVLDHMACVDVARGPGDASFLSILAMLSTGHIYIKLSICRVSKSDAGYADVRPFHDAFVEANEDRLLWGSDWPFVRMGNRAPDAGRLLDVFREWVVDETIRQKILVETPAILYGF